MLSYTLTDVSAVVLLNNRVYTVASDHPKFDELKAALAGRDEAAIEALISLPNIVKEYIAGDQEFTVEGGLVMYQDRAFAEAVSKKVLRMLADGCEAKGLLNCLRKLRLNPSRVAQEEALLFFVANDCLIHEDGDFIAFKGVDANYKDRWTHKVDNRVGQVPEMPRGEVDDRRDRVCSHGYHIGAKAYAQRYASGQNEHVMIVKANPKDVVSVPNDASDRKCRVCRYEVIGELTGEWQHREVYSNQDLDLDEDVASCTNCAGDVDPMFAVATACGTFCNDICRDEYEDTLRCDYCAGLLCHGAHACNGVQDPTKRYCSTLCRGADLAGR